MKLVLKTMFISIIILILSTSKTRVDNQKNILNSISTSKTHVDIKTNILNSTKYFNNDVYETFLPTDEVFVEVFKSHSLMDNNFTVNVYKFNDSKSFIAYTDLKDSLESGLISKPILTLNTKLFQEDKEPIIKLNQTLDAGHYLIRLETEVDGKPIIADKLIQVHPLSVYSFLQNDQLCFWVNDTNTGKPAENVNISIDNNILQTDKNGVSTYTLLEKNKESLVTMNLGDYPEFIYTLPIVNKKELEVAERYYSYIYTDRVSYKKDDIINVFGVVRQKYENNVFGVVRQKHENYPIPKDAVFRVVRQKYENYPIPKDAVFKLKIKNIISKPIKLKEDGTFTAQIPTTDLSDSEILELLLNDEPIDSKYVSLIDNIEEKYILEFISDKKVYTYGETAKCSILATTPDGKPIEGLSILFFEKDSIPYYDFSFTENEKLFKTDKDGMIYFEQYIPINEYATNLYEHEFEYSIVVNGLNLPKQRSNIVISPSDVNINSSYYNNGTLEITLNKIDINKIEQFLQKQDFMYIREKDYCTDLIDLPITLDIEDAQKFKQGYTTRFIETRELITTNGKITIYDLPLGDERTRYYGTISTNDTTGKDISEGAYWGSAGFFDHYKPSNLDNIYYLTIKENIKINNFEYKFTTNETKEIFLQNVYNEIIENGSILTIIAGDKIYDTKVSLSTETDFMFKEQYISNVNIYGAYFDGKHVYKCEEPLYIDYKPLDRKLNIDVKFDKQYYSPLSEVNADISVTDINGNPKEASLIVSVVDESTYSIDESDFLNNYYENTYFGYEQYIYCSYNPHVDYTWQRSISNNDVNSHIGNKNVSNPATFLNVYTDKNGKATVNFKLPNIKTSWRVTTLAISEDNYVGDNKSHVLSKF